MDSAGAEWVKEVGEMVTSVFSEPLVQVTLISSLTGLTVIYAAVLMVFSEEMKQARARSWVVTLIASVVLSLSSLPFLLEFLYYGGGDVRILHHSSLSALSEGDDLMMSFSLIVSSFFMAYLIADIMLGLISYPTELTLVTGWIHHTVYLGLLTVLIYHRLAPAFCLMAFLEVPTVVLALGHLSKAHRRDNLFGALFFLSRIAFHGYMIHQFYHHFPGLWWRWFAGIYPLHLYWFSSWVRKQVSLYREKRKEAPLSRKSLLDEPRMARLHRQTDRLLKMAMAPLRRRHA